MKAKRFLIVLIILAAIGLHGDERKSGQFLSPSVVGELVRMNINNIDLPLRNDGSTGNDGQGYYPSGQTELAFLFSGGFATSGYVNDSLRASWMAPANLLFEWLPGKWGINPNHSLARFYEASIHDRPGSTAYFDWANAVSLGADFVDVNGDGLYDPHIDKPALLGEKMIWTVFNDSTVYQSPGGLGTKPLGLEIHQTVWAYNRQSLKDVIFFWQRLINVTANSIDTLIYSVWVDPDLGEYTDDLVGCDTTLDLGYVYNHGDDPSYGIDPPTFGIKLLQGPLTVSPGDTAQVFRGLGKGLDMLLGMKNLPMTSFVDPFYGIWGPPIQWKASMARNLQVGGKYWNGEPIDPTQWGTGGTPDTDPKFLASGDPVSGSGWRDNSPADKRFLVNCGPFDLAAGDTQDIVFAYVIGRGTDALNSITVLRENTGYLDSFFPAGRILALVANDTLISVDSTFAFQPLLLSLAFADTFEYVDWQLLSRPSGSSAHLSVSPGFRASLKPDLPGDYTLAIQAALNSGVLLSDTLTTTAVDNHPPHPRLSLSSSVIQYGQSAIADAGASADPDGDDLQFEWHVPAWVKSQPLSPSTLNLIPLHTGVASVQVSVSDSIFRTAAAGTLKVAPLMDGLVAVDSLPDLSDIKDLAYHDGLVYVLHGDSSFTVLDADDISRTVGSSFLRALRFQTDGAIVISARDISSSRLYLHTIDANYQLTQESFINFPHFVSRFYLRSDFLFVALRNFNMEIYDISDLATPVRIFTLPVLTWDVAFRENRAAGYSRNLGLFLLDISDPLNITELDLLPLNFGLLQTVSVMGEKRIYLHPLPQQPSDEMDIYVIEYDENDKLTLSDTLHVEAIIGDSSANLFSQMTAYQSLLFLGTREGLRVYDARDPQAVVEASSRQSGSPVAAIAYREPYIYSAVHNEADFGGGLFVLASDSILVPGDELPESFRLYQNYPNPFNAGTLIPYDLPEESHVELAVFNILGQKVRTLVSSRQPPDAYEVHWDGTNDAGRPVASGVYIYRLVVNPPSKGGRGDVQSRKMLLLR